tara:strand:- start:503 stop:907 length:405 start_codon:yes stop_codon:yes gene_type:complete
MRNARIELPGWITDKTVEKAYHDAQVAAESHNEHFAQVGMRAGLDQNPRLLLALEKGSEVLASLVEKQVGRYQRGTEKYGHKAELTELGLWRTAYEAVDAGKGGADDSDDGFYYKLYPYRWILGSAASLAGLQP